MDSHSSFFVMPLLSPEKRADIIPVLEIRCPSGGLE